MHRHLIQFQSRYRAAFHFRPADAPRHRPIYCFNLVIERLFISGASTRSHRTRAISVSISLSSGFSFQDIAQPSGHLEPLRCFNLVIERLFISGHCGDLHRQFLSVSISLSSGFSFQGVGCTSGGCRHGLVSISLSSGFSFQDAGPRAFDRHHQPFQSRYRAAFHFRPQGSTLSCGGLGSRFNLVIERLFISGTRPRLRRRSRESFNLVIERLFISGRFLKMGYLRGQAVSISLSSGFSFQAKLKRWEWGVERCFNLVIERLFISGRYASVGAMLDS